MAPETEGWECGASYLERQCEKQCDGCIFPCGMSFISFNRSHEECCTMVEYLNSVLCREADVALVREKE
jgi:hypothetical protein